MEASHREYPSVIEENGDLNNGQANSPEDLLYIYWSEFAMLSRATERAKGVGKKIEQLGWNWGPSGIARDVTF